MECEISRSSSALICLEYVRKPPNPSFHRTCAKSRAGPVNSDVRRQLWLQYSTRQRHYSLKSRMCSGTKGVSFAFFFEYPCCVAHADQSAMRIRDTCILNCRANGDAAPSTPSSRGCSAIHRSARHQLQILPFFRSNGRSCDVRHRIGAVFP